MMSSPGPIQPAHPQLGRFLVRRQRRAFHLILAILLGVLGLSIAIPGLVLALLPPAHAGTRASPAGGAALTAFGLLIVGAAWLALRGARTSVAFYELGAVRSVGHRQTMIPYAEADRFKFALTRQHVNGLYVGTSLSFRLRTPDKRSIPYDGSFKLKAKGFFRREYEVHDEMERVKQMIAEQMALSFVDRLLAGETIHWCGHLAMTAQGLTPLRGRHKGELMPYQAIVGQSARNGYVHLMPEHAPRSLPALHMSAENFWPCYFAFLQLAGLLEVLSDADAAAVPALQPGEASSSQNI